MEEGDGEEVIRNPPPEPRFAPFNESNHRSEGAEVPNPKYRDGNVLPKELMSRFLSEAKPCVPLDEIDPYYWNRQTFVALGQGGYIYRFSQSTGNHLTLNPNSAVRKCAIYLYTNWLFSAFLLATILVDIYALIRTKNGYAVGVNDEEKWTLDAWQTVDYICLAVYSFELIVKLVARGLFPGEFTAVRSPWVWLDIIVIAIGIIHPYSLLWVNKGALSWIRIFKLVPLIPSIRRACRLSFEAVKLLAGMIPLFCLMLWLFSLIGTQIYMGTLTQKCIKQFPEGMEISDEMWTEHNQNTSNWLSEGHAFQICGNASGSRKCPKDYTCLKGYGSSPDNDFTKFDDIFWSLLSVLRIAGEDFTEEILKQLVAANGPFHIIFFVTTFFLITLPMGCLFFSILGDLFMEKWEEKTSDEENSEATAATNVNDDNASKTGSQLNGFKKNLHSIANHSWMTPLVICVIYIDIFGIASYYYGIEHNFVANRLFTQFFPFIVSVVYVIEFLVKVIPSGPRMYFRDAWNSLDLLILLQFSVQFASHSGYLLAPIRVLKLLKYWPSLQLILAIYLKTLSVLKGWILYGCLVMGFIVLTGPYHVGLPKGTSTSASQEPTPVEIDFYHSFRMVARMQVAEWIETLWDVLEYTSRFNAFSYYLVANVAGALFVSYVLVAVVFLTMKKLQSDKDSYMGRKIRRIIITVLSHIPGIKSRVAHLQNEFDSLPILEDDEPRFGVRERGEATAMQLFTENWAYKTGCLAVIILGSFSMTLLDDVNVNLTNGVYVAMLAIEFIFTGSFVIIVIFEMIAFGLKKSAMNCSLLFDTLIVVENIINLCSHFNSSLNIPGPFGVGAFYIRCFRPLMLISRMNKLKASYRLMVFELKQIWEIILAIFFIWLLFDTFAVHWLSGLYYKCIDPNFEKEVRLDKNSCIAQNYTWQNSYLNFDNSGLGFLNMVFLVTRMGWFSIISDASDATEHDMPRIKDNSKMWVHYFILFLISGGLGALGMLFSHVMSMYLQEKGCTIILTRYQADIYHKRKREKEKEQNPGVELEQEYISAPTSSLSRKLYKLVTNWKFDVALMLVIILDNVILSLERFQQSDLWRDVLFIVSLIFLILYIAEAIVKVIAWGKDYFQSGWNILDFIIVLGSVGLFVYDVAVADFTCPGLLRVFRLLRIFRFLLSKKWGSTTVKAFISAASNVRHSLGNLILFQLTVMWAFSVLGVRLFEHVRHDVGIDDWLLNFTSFGNAFTVMTLLLGFPCLDGFYIALTHGNCATGEDGVVTNCGNRTAAVVYLGLYASITFLVMLNLYAVFITEIMSEFARYKGKAANEEGGDKLSLQNVVTGKVKNRDAVNDD